MKNVASWNNLALSFFSFLDLLRTVRPICLHMEKRLHLICSGCASDILQYQVCVSCSPHDFTNYPENFTNSESFDFFVLFFQVFVCLLQWLPLPPTVDTWWFRKYLHLDLFLRPQGLVSVLQPCALVIWPLYEYVAQYQNMWKLCDLRS